MPHVVDINDSVDIKFHKIHHANFLFEICKVIYTRVLNEIRGPIFYFSVEKLHLQIVANSSAVTLSSE